MPSLPPEMREFRAKIQFITMARMPSLIYKACVKTGKTSNTRYIQEAVCAALSRDLQIDYQELLNELPSTRGKAGRLLHGVPNPARPGPGNTVEEVK